MGSEPVEVELLGRQWRIARSAAGTVTADPEPAGLRDELGLVWLAPQSPPEALDELVACPSYVDSRFARVWLEPSRTSAAAALLADNFLDMAHFPFVHAGTFGSADDVLVPRYEVERHGVEIGYSYVHGYLNDEDPGVAAGLRPRRQTRRVTALFRLPFQMTLTLEHIESGGTTVILFTLQPESATSTVAYTCVLRDHIGGGPVDVAATAAFEQAVLDEDLALQADIDLDGLPLDLRDEVHVRADAAGIELRRCLASLVALTATAVVP
ncbi:hypothetical protein [Desertimonas flava]|uniref:hypothetical protein n=1 Tax=Desertimonas flava TaxID=2064846 RepID=UPI0013C4CB77|nr:hypothetical protein [Desertimonas flava]